MQKFANNAVGTLASAISDLDVTLVLSGSEGNRFPSLTPGDYFMATIVDEDGNREIVKVTARVGNTLTVQRGQEGTQARAFIAGSKVSHRLTAGALGEFLQRTEADEIYLKKSDSGAFPKGTRMLFQQTNAPTGWTKDTTHDNKALRVVSGAAGQGGSDGFSSVFKLHNLNGSIDGTNLSVHQLAEHNHRFNFTMTSIRQGTGATVSVVTDIGNEGFLATTDSSGFGVEHTHNLDLDSLDLRVAYVDVIIAQKA